MASFQDSAARAVGGRGREAVVRELNDTGRTLSRLIGRPTAPFANAISAAFNQG
ncbi:hypothetical protein [Corallococcus carmarthensis]|uniref:hypothetical protein n=1 Tax=Corallococcus carmarthensis TaxID=2316728 RepID=UPI001ABFECBC|nr:hypothetical protein [Corallococcus carmarthensis]